MKREITKTEETGNKPEIFVLRPYNHKQLADFLRSMLVNVSAMGKKE
ncbi:MAG: hypothetical protein U5K54_15315 [Cytophagales bacterium]|nr:hypothetical protein [Cytophagales bacterium]